MVEAEPPDPEQSTGVQLNATTRGLRIVVSGTSGAGKTTLAKQLSERLGVPHVEFDAIRHGPNWVETPDDIFRERVAEALKGDAWVADGNYSVIRDIAWSRATSLVWLDYPFAVVMWRLFWRTMVRGIMRVELWNGNREKLWWHFFTKESLFLWVFQTHWRRRRTITIALAQPEYSHLEVMRFRSPRETSRWLKGVSKAKL